MNKYNAQKTTTAPNSPNAITTPVAPIESPKPVLQSVPGNKPVVASTPETPAATPVVAPAPEAAPAPVELKPIESKPDTDSVKPESASAEPGNGKS